MATRPKFDFSHLTPAERLELAEQLWDSLNADAIPVTGPQAAELRRRRALLDQEAAIRPSHISETAKGYMAAGTTKDLVLGVVQQLPEDATVEQAIEQIYFLAKVEEGLRQADAGEVVSHEDAKRRLLG